MTPGEQQQLYETDRQTWIKYAAPRLAKRMEDMTEAQLNHAWDFAGEDYKHAVWALLDGSQQSRLRKARGTRPVEAPQNKPARINRKPAHRKMTDAQLACLQGDV